MRITGSPRSVLTPPGSLILRLCGDSCRRSVARNEGRSHCVFLSFFSLFLRSFGVVGVKSGAAQFRNLLAVGPEVLFFPAAVEGFTDAASSVSEKGPRACARGVDESFCLKRLTVRRPDVSRSGAVCRARRTGFLPSGRTEPGTMGSRGGPCLATSRQVRNHQHKQNGKPLNFRLNRRLAFFHQVFARNEPAPTGVPSTSRSHRRTDPPRHIFQQRVRGRLNPQQT